MSKRLIAALACLLGPCLGCQGYSQARRCLELADFVNSSVEEIAAMDSQDGGAARAETYAEIAKKYLALDEGLGRLEEEQDKEMRKAIVGFRATLRVISKEAERYDQELRTLAVSKERNDDKRVSRAQRQLEQARKRMAKLQTQYDSGLDRIGRACQIQ